MNKDSVPTLTTPQRVLGILAEAQLRAGELADTDFTPADHLCEIALELQALTDDDEPGLGDREFFVNLIARAALMAAAQDQDAADEADRFVDGLRITAYFTNDGEKGAR